MTAAASRLEAQRGPHGRHRAAKPGGTTLAPGGPPPKGTTRTARFRGVRVPVDPRPAIVVQPPYIMLSQPALIIGAVRDVVGQVRRG